MSGVKGRSGRKPKSIITRDTARILKEATPTAAAYLKDVSRGIAPPLKRTTTRKNGDVTVEEMWGGDSIRVDVCKYIINQDLGMPRQKQEVIGDHKVTVKVVYDGSPIKTSAPA